MMKTFTYTLGLLAAIAQVSATSLRDLTLFEKLNGIPEGWKQGPSVPASTALRFRLAVVQENAYDFEQHVINISTPGHPKYGMHMSREELKRRLQPSKSAKDSLLAWLDSEGVSNIVDDGDWINFAVLATDAERIMDTKFYYYMNKINGVEAIRTLQYSVPDNVKPYIQMIQPTTRFGQINPQRSTAFKIGEAKSIASMRGKGIFSSAPSVSAFNATFCNTTVTPDCLRDLYKVGNHTASGNSSNKLGISGYLEEYAKYADLEQFLKTFAPQQDPAKNNFTYALVNGGKDTQNDTSFDSVEANLDAQYALSLAYKTPATYYSTGGRGPLVPDLDQPGNVSDNEPYLDLLHYLLALPDDELPTTLTTSYGENEQSIPESYTNSTCSIFAQLGARGVSVLFSSGDTGVGSACQTNDGKNTTRFLPTFPGACPFVTSVGGTYRVQPERAISFSSGGFSDRFPRPAYQNAAVTEYLDILGDTWKGLYNPAGRGFPDVAAQSNRFQVVDDGQVISVGGTSASSPTFAGIVALLNDARLSAGKPALGFLNPWIYSGAYRGLTDIVDGGSTGCTGTDIYSGLPTPVVPFASWNATKGWDPVTGYGTPIFPKLLKLALESY